MALRIKRIKHQISTTIRSTAEHKELTRMWKSLERKWHVDIEDVSAEMAFCTKIVKEVTFKDYPDSSPLHITLEWDSVRWAEDGTKMSEFEIEKKIAKQVDDMLAFLANEHAI